MQAYNVVDGIECHRGDFRGPYQDPYSPRFIANDIATNRCLCRKHWNEWPGELAFRSQFNPRVKAAPRIDPNTRKRCTRSERRKTAGYTCSYRGKSYHIISPPVDIDYGHP